MSVIRSLALIIVALVVCSTNRAMAVPTLSPAPGYTITWNGNDGLFSSDTTAATVPSNIARSSSGAIAFGTGASTRMACPPPLDTLEQSLGQALAASAQWRIEGDRLELLDEAGVQTLLCEAVYLK